MSVEFIFRIIGMIVLAIAGGYLGAAISHYNPSWRQFAQFGFCIDGSIGRDYSYALYYNAAGAGFAFPPWKNGGGNSLCRA